MYRMRKRPIALSIASALAGLVLCVVLGKIALSAANSAIRGRAPAARHYATDNPHKSLQDRAVQSAVDEFLSEYRPVGFTIATVHNGVESCYNYGEKRAGTGVLPTSRTIYEIASITKTMTGILLARAVLDRKLSLDADIRTYLPGSYPNLQFAGKPILLKHLATHTSGLPDDPPSIPDDDAAAADAYKRFTHAKLLADLALITLPREPGSKWSYSNMGAGLIGLILERAYGRSYEQLLDAYVFGPARMSHSGIALTAEMDREYATPHDAAGAQTHRWILNGIEAAGAVRSNAEDMLRYARLNLSETDPAVTLSHKLLPIGRKVHHGMLWPRSRSNAWGNYISHAGNTDGFCSDILVIPDRKLAVVVLMNSAVQPVEQLAGNVARSILRSQANPGASQNRFGNGRDLRGRPLATWFW